VDVAANGLEAVAALLARPYDIVLMDVQMPEMGGIEATRVIREREGSNGHHTRIVAVTAHAMAGDRERYLAAGMDGYLSKPIDPTALFAAVEHDRPFGDRRRAERRSPVAATLGADEMRRHLGSDELVAEVAQAFLHDCPARLAEIGTAIAARDRNAIRAAAHTLKGAAGNLFAGPVIACATGLESMAEDDAFDPIAADATFVLLEAECARLVAAIQENLIPADRGAQP
jgi:CheY-like chemotaxis protein